MKMSNCTFAVLAEPTVTSSMFHYNKRNTWSKINFFLKMWSPKSVCKTFPLQRNTNQNYWLPRACWQNICNWYNQESNKCWDHLLTTLTNLHCHLLMPREYLPVNLNQEIGFILQKQQKGGGGRLWILF